jgi:CBS domain-containing protein
MTCAEVMTKDPSHCILTDSAARAAKIMKTENVGSVPVCETRHSRKLVGIVTDRDLALHIVAEGRDGKETQVQEVMTKDPIICWPEHDLEDAISAMQTHRVRRVPIVDRSGLLVGIISQADVAMCGAVEARTAETLKEISKPAKVRAA